MIVFREVRTTHGDQDVHHKFGCTICMTMRRSCNQDPIQISLIQRELCGSQQLWKLECAACKTAQQHTEISAQEVVNQVRDMTGQNNRGCGGVQQAMLYPF